MSKTTLIATEAELSLLREGLKMLMLGGCEPKAFAPEEWQVALPLKARLDVLAELAEAKREYYSQVFSDDPEDLRLAQEAGERFFAAEQRLEQLQATP